MFTKKQKFAPLPMIPVHIEEPFRQWGIDFIGEIHPASSSQHEWILTATDYFTKWVEVIPVRNTIDAVVIKFMEENIISRFGCPAKIVTDNAQAFKSTNFINFRQQYNITLGHSMAYYPYGNGLAEYSNKTLVRALKNTISENQKNWDSQLKFALWANRITSKRSIGKSPYEQVYGRATIFLIQLAIPVARFLQDSQEESNDLIRRMN